MRWAAGPARSTTSSARAGASIQNCTDANGNPVATGCAAFDAGHPDRNVPASTGYDALGRAYQSIDALGRVTQTSYDGLGRSVAVTENCTDRGGAPSLSGCAAYNALYPDRNVTTGTGYDGLGQTLSTTDGDGNTSSFTYDGLGDQVTSTDPMTPHHHQRLRRHGHRAVDARRPTAG